MDDDIEFLGVNLVSAAEHRRRSHPHRATPMAAPKDVIEVLDSDDGPFQGARSHTPVAGPSRAAQARSPLEQPLVLPDAFRTPSPHPGPANATEEARHASSSASAASRAPSVATPPPVGSIDRYVAQVLEIIPDVDSDHAMQLIMTHMDGYKEKVVEPVLHLLFENPNYPKVGKGKGKGKRKREEDEEEGPPRSKVKIDFMSRARPRVQSRTYAPAALAQLYADYPSAPKNYVKSAFTKVGNFYAPAFFALLAERKDGKLPCKARSERDLAKGKEKALAHSDEAFEEERAWVVAKAQEDAEHADAALAEKLNEQEYEAAGDGIECGCCFSVYPFDKMIQCPEAHLFCIECMSTYCETLLGSHDSNVVCMDQSGCKQPFPESELRRFLAPKLLALYDRVKQRKEIEAAGLENLEECPFCDYKVVIDNPEEKLFRCENAECGAVTCRACKKADHLPKSCREMEEDKKLDARHVIEEAMTRALMRNCPKCTKAFVKEAGCNKMTCPQCRTVSCYVCRKIINGYEHFDQTPGGQPIPKTRKSDRCPLWDTVEQRHADEVAAAAKLAMEEYKREHPDVEEKDMRVELPKAPVAGPSNQRAAVAAPAVHHHAHHAHHAHAHMPQLIAHRQILPPLPAPPLFGHPHMVQLPGLQVGIVGGGMMVPQVQYVDRGPGYQVNINFQPRQMPAVPGMRQPPPPAQVYPPAPPAPHRYGARMQNMGAPPPVAPPVQRNNHGVPDRPEAPPPGRRPARRARARNGRH